MNLTYAENVKKTPAISRSIDLLDSYFDGEPSIITSGLRTPQDQLKIILAKIMRHGIDKDFPEIKENILSDIEHTIELENGETVYWWSRGWSRCLSLGDVVNPPVPAEVMFDYFRPGSQENKKGQIIGVSPHSHGTAFDIGGGDNLNEKAKRVLHAMQSGSCFIKNFLCESINNSVHCDVEQVGGGTG